MLKEAHRIGAFFFSFRTQIHPALSLLFLSADEERKLCPNRVESCFHSLSSKIDQRQFSPNNIHIAKRQGYEN